MDSTNQLRRLSDLLRHLDFLEVQLIAIQRESGPHHIRKVGERIARIHQSMDEIEHVLRLRAVALGESAEMPLSVLRRRLAKVADRRRYPQPVRAVNERRTRNRRRVDAPPAVPRIREVVIGGPAVVACAPVTPERYPS